MLFIDPAARETLRSLSRFSSFTPADRLLVEQQMKGHRFDASGVLAVAHRCRCGTPQVLVCHPFTGSRPFPTLFWLCCPTLSLRCGELESNGGVKALEEEMSQNYNRWRRYQTSYAQLRLSFLPRVQKNFLQRYRPGQWQKLSCTGVGGIALGASVTVKCLHLQVAAWLGMGHHPASTWLSEHLGSLDCSKDCRHSDDRK